MPKPRNPLSVAARSLAWLIARMADLFRAMLGAVSALAGFIGVLSPWLVFAVLALGTASLFSQDMRSWLTGQMERLETVLTGESSGPPGFLYLEAPQVYTRERLVNDRFTQANWLREQLERTGRDSFMESFSNPSSASEEVQRLSVLLASGGLATAPMQEGDEGRASPVVPPSPNKVALDRLELFDRVNVYRAALRGELMDVQLDDGHDLDGNTLYRLNFNAVVAPFVDRRSYPGSAVFLVRAKQPVTGIDRGQLVEDQKELLLQWQREMQAFLTRVLDQRLESFERQSALENPTDPKEDLALDWFMRTKLVEKFLNYLADFPGELAPYLAQACEGSVAGRVAALGSAAQPGTMVDPDKQNLPTQTNTAQSDDAAGASDLVSQVQADKAGAAVRKCRVDTMARLAGFYYRTDKPSPDMSPVHSAGFRRSIELAHLVNAAQWPKAGSGSYDNRCVDDERKKYDAQQRVTAENTGQPPETPGTDDPIDPPTQASASQAEPTADATLLAINAEETELVSTTSDASPDAGQKAGDVNSGVGPPDGPPFEVLVAQRCLIPYEDPYRLRALSRLIAITDDLRTASRAAAQAAMGTVAHSNGSETEPHLIEERVARAKMADLLGKFGEVLPSVAPDEGGPIDAVTRTTIAGLENEMQRLIAQGGRLPELARHCAPLLETGASGDVADVRANAIEYTRCRFLFAPSGNVRGILAEFIVARVGGELQEFYRETEPALTDFLTVKTDGCALTDCRIRVDLREDMDEAVLAETLADALDARTNGLSIYEISPRAETIVRGAGRSSDLSAGLVAPQGRVSAGSLQGERTAYAEPAVLGFSAPVPAEEAVFGWTVRPQARPDGRWSSSHHRLSAVISVPSWWKRLDLEIHACWITPQLARSNAETLFDRPLNICAAVYDEHKTSAPRTDGNDQIAPPLGHFKRSVRVQLPRSVDEVTARFNFDLVKTPYFDPAWRRDYEGAETALVAGRPAHIALAGERLWRGTVVTIDGQPADRITVLPDMKGVIAEFHCVRPSPRALTGAANQSRVKLTVWTAEGRTKPMDIDVRPFDAIEGTDEKPCYLRASDGGTETSREVDAPSVDAQ